MKKWHESETVEAPKEETSIQANLQGMKKRNNVVA